MSDSLPTLREVEEDLQQSRDLGDYEAVEVLWAAIVKLGNLSPGGTERGRIVGLLSALTAQQKDQLLTHPAIGKLLNLEPPLEEVASNLHERLSVQETRSAIMAARNHKSDREAALQGLTDILRRIRNKRVHGFKTRKGPRDGVVLNAARSLLEMASRNCLESAKSRIPPGP